MSTEITIDDQPDASRYIAHDAGGAQLGYLTYEPRGEGVVAFTHTVTDPAAQGRGVASSLVRRAIADARQRGQRIVPVCSFVGGWLDKHPEEKDVVA